MHFKVQIEYTSEQVSWVSLEFAYRKILRLQNNNSLKEKKGFI